MKYIMAAAVLVASVGAAGSAFAQPVKIGVITTLSGGGAGLGSSLHEDGVEQVAAVDLGIDLGGRQAGVAEQLLDGAQVAAGAEQVGGETVAQGMGGGGIG